MFSNLFIGFLSILLIYHCYATAMQNEKTEDGSDYVDTEFVAANCSVQYNLKCFKLDVLDFIKKYSDKQEVYLLPGISVVRDLNGSDVKNEEIILEMGRNFPIVSADRLDGFLISNLTNYLLSHTLRLKFGKSGKMSDKKGGILGGFLAAAVIIKGLVVILALGGLALLAGKALVTALAVILLSAVIGFKSLTSKNKQTTYEIIANPVYSHSNTHATSHEDIRGGGYGHGAYGRSVIFELPEHITNQ